MESEFSALFLLLSLCTHEGNFMLENCRVQSRNFIAALDICQKYRSELADVNQTRAKIKSCDEIKKEEMFLVNEVAVQTPVLDLLGCFQVSDYRDSTPVSSIPECFSHCHPLKTFGVSGQSRLHCFCIDPNTNVVREQSLDPFRCRVDDSQSSTYMEVYTALDDKRNGTDINSIPTKCEDSWDAATQACLSKTNSYLADTIHLSDCHYVARKIQNVFTTATFWSSRRSYNADFSVKGNKSKGRITEVSKCIVVSENEKREVSCDEDNNFFCLDHVDNIRETPPDPNPIIITVIVLVLAVVLGVIIIALIKKRKLENCCAEPRHGNASGEGYSRAETFVIEQDITTPYNNEDATSHAEKRPKCQEVQHSGESHTDEMKEEFSSQKTLPESSPFNPSDNTAVKNYMHT